MRHSARKLYVFLLKCEEELRDHFLEEVFKSQCTVFQAVFCPGFVEALVVAMRSKQPEVLCLGGVALGNLLVHVCAQSLSCV